MPRVIRGVTKTKQLSKDKKIIEKDVTLENITEAVQEATKQYETMGRIVRRSNVTDEHAEAFVNRLATRAREMGVESHIVEGPRAVSTRTRGPQFGQNFRTEIRNANTNELLYEGSLVRVDIQSETMNTLSNVLSPPIIRLYRISFEIELTHGVAPPLMSAPMVNIIIETDGIRYQFNNASLTSAIEYLPQTITVCRYTATCNDGIVSAIPN